MAESHDSPGLIFEGLLQVFSTCRICGEIMLVTSADDRAHPCCDPDVQPGSLATGVLSAIMCGDTAAAQFTASELGDSGDLAGAACAYARDGWPVFPLGKRSKAPAIPKSRGGKGFHDATNDVERIERWWMRHRAHNIGFATGHCFDVLDVDPRNGGVPSFRNLLRDKSIPDAHGIAITASGGMHLYLKPANRRSYPGLAPGIDYKALGGYVVGPPSTLGKHQSYTWLVEPSPMIKH